MHKKQRGTGKHMNRERASRQVTLIALITAACLIGDSMLYIVLPVHFAAAGLDSLWQVGVILSVNRLVRLPLNPAVGWLYRHISDRTGLLVATVLATLTTLGYAVATGFVMWLLLRCLWGLSWTLLRLGGFYCVLNVSSESDRGYFMGLYNGLYRLGSLVGMLAGGLFADWLGFGMTAFLFGGCTALAVVVCLFSVPRGHVPEPSYKTGKARLRMGRADLWIMGTGLAVALIYQGLYASTLSQLLQVHLGDEFRFLGLAVGVATLGGALQALRWAWEPWLAPWFGVLSDRRFSRRAVLTASFGCGVIIFGLISLHLPVAIWLVLLLAAQLVGTALTTVADAVASDAASVHGGRMFMMWYSFAVDLGAALGPVLAYTLNGIWGMDAVYLGTALLLVVFAVRWGRGVPPARAEAD